MTTLTRRYHFAASHRLHSPHLDANGNRELYGKCNNPFGHGHDYILEVTVTGLINHVTGRITPLAELDRLVTVQVLNALSHRNLNQDVPQFSKVVPTTENIAKLVVDLLLTTWTDHYPQKDGVKLARVHVQETDRNGFTILLPLHPYENAFVDAQSN